MHLLNQSYIVISYSLHYKLLFLDLCEDLTCANGVCTEYSGGVHCVCQQGYMGELCNMGMFCKSTR